METRFSMRIQEFEDENGVRFVFIKIRYGRKNLLKRMMVAGVEFLSEAAFLAYAWKSGFHRGWILMASAMALVSAHGIYKNARRYILKNKRIRRERLRWSCCLATGIITYCTSVHVFSEALKSKNNRWIPCLGVFATSYYLSASSVTRLGRTIRDRSPFLKCCQLLFGPALVGCATGYLMFRQHDEEFLYFMPMTFTALVGAHISLAGEQRVESNNEPRWLLFKGLELCVGGFLLLFNGCLLVGYSVNKDYHPLFSIFYTIIALDGIVDIESSLGTLQRCANVERPVFYCLCGMTSGPLIFLFACLGIRCIDHAVMLPIFSTMAGAGIALVVKSYMELGDHVRPEVFKRYCQRISGPMMTLFGSVFAAYVGYSVRWRYSLLFLPLIPAGIYTSYIGFSTSNPRRRRHYAGGNH